MNDWQAKKSSAERDWLIEKHKPIVYFLAKKIAQSLPFQIDIEDMVAYGQLGLVEASERFDPSRGNNFSTFAHYRIRGAIYDGLREMGVISRSRTHRFAAHANDVLMTQVDDSSIETAGAGVADEIKSVESLIDQLIPIYFLSIDDDTKEIEDETALSAHDYETRDLIGKVRRTIDELEPEESELLKKLYFQNILMKDLAAQMGVNKSWVSRLHARAISRLQAALVKNGILESEQSI